MKRFCFCIIINTFWGISSFGQFLTIGSQEVSKEEFIRLYEKNTPDPTYDEKSMQDYLDRLITYKLKVQEALDQKVDNSPQIQNDLKNYAEQLAQPYLTDKELLEEMLKEVYGYLSQDVHARQVMIRCSPFANPRDTLAAYKIALRIKERLTNGEDFDSVAQDESEKSDLISLGGRREKQVSSSDLRYFSAFTVPYSMEKYVFSANIGDYSPPLRTDIGYHIVQLLDRQPTLGKINASQIFLNVPKDGNEREIKRRADSLYYLITNGTRTFEEIAHKHSDDKNSGIGRGGRMAEFNVQRAEPLFVEQLYKMPVEVVSRPFRAENGYHIVLIHSVSGIDAYDVVRPELLHRFQRDPRAEIVKQSFINSLLKIYPLVELKGALKKFANQLDSTEIGMLWAYEINDFSDSLLCKVGDRSVTFENFGKYIEQVQMDYHSEEEPFMAFVERNYRRYIGEVAILCEMDHVGTKHEAFHRDYNEYRDGILAYEITDRKVWGKSSADTTGLYAYYDSQKHCYMWPQRIQALIFKYDVRHINTDDVQKFLSSSYKKRLSAEQIIEQANRNFDPRYISVTVNVYEPGQNKFADRVDWTELGLSKDIAAGSFEKGFVYIYHHYPSTCKSLEDVRGIMVSQFQAFLEKEWVTELRGKYPVQLNEDEFKHLIKK